VPPAPWRDSVTRNKSREEDVMKTLATIARYLLALIFIVFGSNGFVHFIPQPPPW
jgi:hypothetical protein